MAVYKIKHQKLHSKQETFHAERNHQICEHLVQNDSHLTQLESDRVQVLYVIIASNQQ